MSSQHFEQCQSLLQFTEGRLLAALLASVPGMFFMILSPTSSL